MSKILENLKAMRPDPETVEAAVETNRAIAKAFVAKEGASASISKASSEYLSIPYVSQSTLKRYENNPSMINYKPVLKGKKGENENPYYYLDQETSKEKVFGSLIHKAVIEHEKFEEHKEVYMSMLTPRDRKVFDLMLSNFKKNAMCQKIIHAAKYREKVFIFKMPFRKKNGEWVKFYCKVLIDIYTTNAWLVEVKTLQRLEDLKWDIYKYRYDLQMSFYAQALLENKEKVKGCAIIAMEKNPPYESHVFTLDDTIIKRGEVGEEGKCRGWHQILEEFMLNRRPRFKEAVTHLEE